MAQVLGPTVTYVGEPNRVPSSWLQPAEPADGTCLPVPCSAFQIVNTFFEESEVIWQKKLAMKLDIGSFVDTHPWPGAGSRPIPLR